MLLELHGETGKGQEKDEESQLWIWFQDFDDQRREAERLRSIHVSGQRGPNGHTGTTFLVTFWPIFRRKLYLSSSDFNRK